MSYEATPSDRRPNCGETLPVIRLAADQEMIDQHPDLVLAAAEGISDVQHLMGISHGINGDLLTQGQGLSEIESGLLSPKGQLRIERFLDLMTGSGFSSSQDPVFILVEKDLVAEGTNFIFGITSKNRGISIQSIHRFLPEIKNTTTGYNIVRHIARHEYGHLVGLDETSILHTDSRGGLYTGHCTNECTMQQVMSVPEAKSLSVRLEHKSHAGFCSDCVTSLRQI